MSLSTENITSIYRVLVVWNTYISNQFRSASYLVEVSGRATWESSNIVVAFPCLSLSLSLLQEIKCTNIAYISTKIRGPTTHVPLRLCPGFIITVSTRKTKSVLACSAPALLCVPNSINYSIYLSVKNHFYPYKKPDFSKQCLWHEYFGNAIMVGLFSLFLCLQKW